MKKVQKNFIVTAILFALFIVYTVLVKTVDVQTITIGDKQTELGFASMNQAIWHSLGRSQFWYTLTEYLGYIAIVVMFAFALLALIQMIQRKNFFRTDLEFLVLGGFYIVMVAFYLFFEKVVINLRPILEDGKWEPSYPSSHTMLVCCVMTTTIFQCNRLLKNQTFRILADIACVVMIALMVMGRLLSGVHWMTDIFGGVLISATLVMLYYSVVQLLKYKIRRRA